MVFLSTFPSPPQHSFDVDSFIGFLREGASENWIITSQRKILRHQHFVKCPNDIWPGLQVCPLLVRLFLKKFKLFFSRLRQLEILTWWYLAYQTEMASAMPGRLRTCLWIYLVTCAALKSNICQKSSFSWGLVSILVCTWTFLTFLLIIFPYRFN